MLWNGLLGILSPRKVKLENQLASKAILDFIGRWHYKMASVRMPFHVPFFLWTRMLFILDELCVDVLLDWFWLGYSPPRKGLYLWFWKVFLWEGMNTCKGVTLGFPRKWAFNKGFRKWSKQEWKYARDQQNCPFDRKWLPNLHPNKMNLYKLIIIL